jgi:hypothetical protein
VIKIRRCPPSSVIRDHLNKIDLFPVTSFFFACHVAVQYITDHKYEFTVIYLDPSATDIGSGYCCLAASPANIKTSAYCYSWEMFRLFLVSHENI